MSGRFKTLLGRVFYSSFCDKLFGFLGLHWLWAELRIRIVKMHYYSYAKKEYRKGSKLGNLEDYKEALNNHWVSYSEYANEYKFYLKSEEERNEFVSRLRMSYFYLRYVPGVTKPVFRDKQRFLKVFKKYVHRKWLYAPEASYEEFMKLVSNYDCFVKPCNEKQGHGIFKTDKGIQDNDRKLYKSCVRNRMLVEQSIESCDELKVFHPQSLNTIRVVTVSNKDKAEVFGAVIRMGSGGSVVDNAHAGGIFAQINVKNGKIESDGLDIKGNRFITHPDSGIVFRGYKIPQWGKIVDTCCEAAKLVYNPITGWDVVINNQGLVEFVEGNNGPGFGIMQSPLNVGVKKRIFALINDYCGVEMK